MKLMRRMQYLMRQYYRNETDVFFIFEIFHVEEIRNQTQMTHTTYRNYVIFFEIQPKTCVFSELSRNANFPNFQKKRVFTEFSRKRRLFRIFRKKASFFEFSRKIRLFSNFRKNASFSIFLRNSSFLLLQEQVFFFRLRNYLK